MIEGVIIKNLPKFEDGRGWLTEIFRTDELSGYTPVMSYISATKPGVARGPHEHQFQSDCFVFIGPGNFELYLWDKKGEEMKLEVGEKNPSLVIVPPGIVHGYKCIGNIDAWCINLPDKLYKGKNKSEEVDEIRWETNPDSPYHIT